MSFLVDLSLWICLVVALAACWWLTLFGLPGNWLIVALAVGDFYLVDPERRVAMGTFTLCVLAGLALLGELLELAAGSVGAKRAGGSRRGALLAIVGAIVGAVTGAVIGLPIPIIGSAAAAVLFASPGAAAGAVLGETSGGKTLDESWRIGHAAFWGRLFGTLGKVFLGAVMVCVAAVAALL